jgi:hypothetical protein
MVMLAEWQSTICRFNSGPRLQVNYVFLLALDKFSAGIDG